MSLTHVYIACGCGYTNAGQLVRQVIARDLDGDELTYEITGSTTNGADIFFITPKGGQVRTLRAISEATENSYTVSESMSQLRIC